MKTVLALVVLAVVAAVSHSFVIGSTRANLNVGYVNVGDRLLHRATVRRNAVTNAVQYEDIVYRGNATTRITAVQATEIGVTQYGTPHIIAGGINQRNVTVRFTSARGRGYNYQLDIWGH